MRLPIGLALAAAVAVPAALAQTAPQPRPEPPPNARPATPATPARPGGGNHNANRNAAHHAAKRAPHRPPPAPAPAAAAPAPLAPEPEKEQVTKGSNTGNPLPRYATLRSDEVNLRTGPGTRYPIDWVYKRRDLPVLIEREFEVWRLVRDPEGVKGWVHQATLAPRRTGVVVGGEQALRSDPKIDAAAVARLKPGVIVRLRSCEATSDWCQATVGDYRGWVRRTDIWGVLPGEAIQ